MFRIGALTLTPNISVNSIPSRTLGAAAVPPALPANAVDLCGDSGVEQHGAKAALLGTTLQGQGRDSG